MTTVVRGGLLVLYLVGILSLDRYARRHPPASHLGVYDLSLWVAMLRIIGPTLWFLPGFLWVGIPGLPEKSVLLLSILLPLSCFAAFLLYCGMSGIYPSLRKAVALIVTAGGVLLLTVAVVVWTLSQSDLSLRIFALFCASLVVPSIFLVYLLSLWSSVVVPGGHNGLLSRRQAVAALLGFAAARSGGTWQVEGGEITTRIKGNSAKSIGPGLLMTEPESAVILKAGSKIARVAGPGVVLIARGETPFRVVDLRNQLRSMEVSAVTRDGIEVCVPISCAFRVHRGRKRISLRQPWPFRYQRDVLQVMFSEEVDPGVRNLSDENVLRQWQEFPIRIAAHKLEHVISFYSLDQLYSGITDQRALLSGQEGHQTELLWTHRRAAEAIGLSSVDRFNSVLARATIGRIVLQSVKQMLTSRGFDVYDGGIWGRIEPVNQEVTKQRVAVWKSRFAAKVMDWHATVERQRLQALARVRQEAFEKMLSRLVGELMASLELAGDASDADRLAYRLLGTLVQMAQNPEVQEMLPESALPALEHLQSQLVDSMSGEETQ